MTDAEKTTPTARLWWPVTRTRRGHMRKSIFNRRPYEKARTPFHSEAWLAKKRRQMALGMIGGGRNEQRGS